MAVQRGLPRDVAKNLFLSLGAQTLLAASYGTLGLLCGPAKRATP